MVHQSIISLSVGPTFELSFSVGLILGQFMQKIYTSFNSLTCGNRNLLGCVFGDLFDLILNRAKMSLHFKW